MDYSDRVNSKKGAGAVADQSHSNAQTKRRIKELLTSHVLDLEKDPYVFKNHLGLLECRLCLTTHTNEASYISHLGGRKHSMNLERRRILEDKHSDAKQQPKGISVNAVETRHWKKIGKPEYHITKIRDEASLRTGVLIQLQLPRIVAEEPSFRFLSHFEMSPKNQHLCRSFLHQTKPDYDHDDVDATAWQYLVVSAEPYDNVAFAMPKALQVEKPGSSDMSDAYWWFWDRDSKEYFLQFLFAL